MNASTIFKTLLSLLCLFGLTAGTTFAQQLRLRPDYPRRDIDGQYVLGIRTKTVPVDFGGASRPLRQPAPNWLAQPQLVPHPDSFQLYGQMVISVTPRSPAQQAGLEIGDVIIEANGQTLDCTEDLARAIATSNGRLAMKIIDVRTNRIAWRVAQLTPDCAVPNPHVGRPLVYNDHVGHTAAKPFVPPVPQRFPVNVNVARRVPGPGSLIPPNSPARMLPSTPFSHAFQSQFGHR